jgi:hypothetical protein
MEALLQLYRSWEDPNTSLVTFHGSRAHDVLKSQLALIPEATRSMLNHFHGNLPVRCVLAALVTGDLWGLQFWTVAKYYLEAARVSVEV